MLLRMKSRRKDRRQNPIRPEQPKETRSVIWASFNDGYLAQRFEYPVKVSRVRRRKINEYCLLGI
jgi:hypothetical protein